MNTEEMAEYICECNVNGLGKKLSQDIVDRFGIKTFDVILNDWTRLMNVEAGCLSFVLYQVNPRRVFE